MNTKDTNPKKFLEVFTSLEESGVDIKLDMSGNILINDFPYTREEMYKFAEHLEQSSDQNKGLDK